jgi:hypothetical protein
VTALSAVVVTFSTGKTGIETAFSLLRLTAFVAWFAWFSLILLLLVGALSQIFDFPMAHYVPVLLLVGVLLGLILGCRYSLADISVRSGELVDAALEGSFHALIRCPLVIWLGIDTPKNLPLRFLLWGAFFALIGCFVGVMFRIVGVDMFKEQAKKRRSQGC